MRPDWEKGLRGRIYRWGRRALPLAWRRAVRRRVAPERLLGIQKPPVLLSRLDFDPRALPPGRPDFLVLPVIPWSYRRQRPQQLAEAIARRGKRVFYLTLEGEGEATAPTGVAPGVTLLPLAGVRREDPADRRLEGRSLETAFQSLAKFRDDLALAETVLFVESPFWTPLALQARDRFGWKVIYDCLDEHGAFGTNRGPLEEMEERLARDADLVVATSAPLAERMLRFRSECRLLPNACDFELFASVPDRKADPQRMTVGYAGAVDRWFDGSLVDGMARLRPNWTFEIVGGIENEADVGRAPAPNVTYFGERPHAEMAGFRSRWDAEIIPFRLSELTHATDPVKLYEAAAAGRGVVATPMRSLEPAARLGLVRPAADADAFVRAVEETAAEDSGRAAARRAFARENTWDIRAEQLCAWTATLLRHGSGQSGLVSMADFAALAARKGAWIHFPFSIGWNVVLVQRPHHLARAFSRRGVPVVFDLESGKDADSAGLREVEPNLFLARGGDSPKPEDVPGRIVWAFARNVPPEGALAGARLVYDVIDHLDVFPGRPATLRENQARALAAAERVFAVSEPLLAEVRRSRPDAISLPNGVDCAHFAAPQEPALLPEALRAARELRRPVAGYTGALARWVDLDLIRSLARLRPDWTLVLVGEALDESLAEMGDDVPENLVYAGPVSYDAIPSVLAAFDVGLIPFRLGSEGLHASPIKLYEYCAAGLPVVSAPLPESRALPEVRIAASAEEFAANLDAALRDRRDEEFGRRARARAQDNDWSRRAETALAALGLSG